jgi:hypothetical protein
MRHNETHIQARINLEMLDPLVCTIPVVETVVDKGVLAHVLEQLVEQLADAEPHVRPLRLVVVQ